MSREVDTTKSKMSALGQVISGLGIADLARRMGDFAKSTLEAGEQSGLVGIRIKNLAGQFNETAAVTKLAADSAERYGLGQLEAADGVSSLYARLRPMGISLEQIGSTFIGVNNAAKQAGLSTYDAGEAFRQLGQAMGSGKLQGDELRSLMERMPAIGRAIVDVFNDTARSTKVTVGDLKQLGADGVITTDIIVMAMKKLEQIQPPPPTAMQQFTAAMADLRMELGENLLPLLTPGIQLLTGLLRAFNGLPGPIKAVAGSVLVLAGALAAIALPLAGFVGSIKMLAGIGLWTTITGAFTGFLTFVGTTFVPALLAFFSGPAGWITLAVIAVGGMVYAFREPIGNFISWMGEQLVGLGKSIGGWLAEVAKTVYGAVDTIKSAIQAGIKFTWDYISGAVGSVAESLARPFTTAAEAIKGVLRSVLQFGANIINGFLGAVNQAISAVNNVASRVNLPQLPTFSPVSVPSFEGGGYTGNAPRVGGLDGRGGFPAILHPRETIIDHARPGRQSSTPPAINIPITTGPVYRLPDGTDTVSMGDFQAGMQALASGILAQLATPAGRMALGGA
jgi:tape measure domain-containing protein